MTVNESTVEDAALEWFEGLGYAVGHGATFVRLRCAKPHLHQSRTLATLRDTPLPKLLSGELPANMRTG